MSIGLVFVRKYIINELEAEFIKHSPEIQKQILAECQVLLGELSDWMQSKALETQPSTPNGEQSHEA